jgi:hypothetical protein
LNQNPEDAVQQVTYGDGGGPQVVNGAKTGAVGAVDARLAELVDIWPTLSDSVKSEILKLVRDSLDAIVAD